MKRTILLLLAFLCSALAVTAQDLIVKTDATQVEAKVTEIAPDVVRYKRFSNPDGPTYVLPVKDIWYIRYANGETESFNAASSAPAAPAPAVAEVPVAAEPSTPAAPPVTPAAPVQATTVVSQTGSGQYVLKLFEIGELYDYNGVKGIICMLTDDKQHGLIMSLDEIYLPWSGFRKQDLRVVGAENRTEGIENMATVEKYIVENNLSWDDFPAFKWCREKGDGWYLPAIDEMLTIGHNYNGGTRVQFSRQARNRFNDTLKENGGKRMDRLVYYFTSTEKDEKEAYTTHMNIEPPYVVEIPKSSKFLVRAVRRF